jgi:hypothetical protein
MEHNHNKVKLYEIGKNALSIKRGHYSHIVNYTPGIADKICTLIIEGKSLSSILHHKCMPSRATVYDWMEEYPEFKQKYLTSRARKAHLLVEQALDAPAQALDKVDSMDIADKRCNAVVQAYKLKSDVNLKVAGLYNRQEYGTDVPVSLPTAIGVQVVFGKCAQQPREVEAEVTEAKVNGA